MYLPLPDRVHIGRPEAAIIGFFPGIIWYENLLIEKLALNSFDYLSNSRIDGHRFT
jgi:hypothetical protein